MTWDTRLYLRTVANPASHPTSTSLPQKVCALPIVFRIPSVRPPEPKLWPVNTMSETMWSLGCWTVDRLPSLTSWRQPVMQPRSLASGNWEINRTRPSISASKNPASGSIHEVDVLMKTDKESTDASSIRCLSSTEGKKTTPTESMVPRCAPISFVTLSRRTKRTPSLSISQWFSPTALLIQRPTQATGIQNDSGPLLTKVTKMIRKDISLIWLPMRTRWLDRS